MFNFLDLLDRSATGEPMAVSDWDFALAMAVRRLVKKYGLDWDRTHVINDDPARADAIFDAALELAIELGVYNYSTGRVVKFTPDELLMGLRKAPQALTLGEGKDARILYARKVCDARPPLAWAGTPGTPVPEHLFLPMAVSYAQEPLVDMMTCGTLTHVDGRVVETGSPLEIVATRRELQYLREAQRRAGRPGIGLLAAQSSVSALGDLSVAHPAYLRPVRLAPGADAQRAQDREREHSARRQFAGVRHAERQPGVRHRGRHGRRCAGIGGGAGCLLHPGEPGLRWPTTTCCTPSTSVTWPRPRAPCCG